MHHHPVRPRSSGFLIAVGALLLTACPEKDAGPPAPTAIVANSSTSVTGIAGTPVGTLPSVRVNDADGNGVAGVSVTFAVTAGGGSGSGLSVATNSSGVATVGSWTLGTTAGTNTMQATSGSLTGSPVTFTATGTAGPAAALAVNAGNTQSAVAGAAVATAPSVKVTDANGNAVAGTSVTFAVASGGGSITGATTTSNAQGIATVGSWTLGTTAGANTLNATAAGISGPATFSATGTAGPASSISIQAGNSQSATVASAVAVAPSVKVVDANNNAVSGATVTFAVASGGGTTGAGTAATNASGIATTTWTLGSTAGANTLTASVTGIATPATFTATGNPGPAANLVAVAGNNQTGAVSSAVPVAPQVKVTDAFGNGIPSAGVTFALGLGGGSVTGATQTTNASGVATIGSWTLGSATGTNTLNATASAVSGAQITFTATAAGATQLGIITQPGGAVTGANLSTQPVVEVRTASGTKLASSTAAVTASINSGTGTLSGTTTVTAVNGVATFTNLRITGTGASTLRFAATNLTAAVSNSFNVTATANDPCANAPTLTVGAAATSGTLASTDCQFSDGSFVDFYKFTITSTKTIRIAMSSATFDTYLLLTNADGTALISYDDDGGGGTNSQITASLQAGTYLVAANSFAPAITGAYTVAVSEVTNDPCSAAAAAITVGGTANGSLATTDCRLTGGQYADRYQFTLAAPTTINASLTSSAFDGYLYLTSATGTTIVEDDDGGTGTNPYISTALPAGTYVLWASSYDAAAVGAYSLTLSTATNACSAAATPITIGSSANGSLASTDCTLQDGTYADRYTFTVASANTDVTISLNSSAFDAVLYLVNSSGATVATDDDGGGGSNARIATTLAAGTYTIYANSYAVATGAYTLALSSPSSACAGSTTISVGQTLSGTLASSDCTLTDGSYADRWQLTLSASTNLSITLTSTAFNSYLYMVDASGALMASDDDGAGGTNAKITGTFAAGTYIIYANSFSAGQSGSYQIAVATGGGGGGGGGGGTGVNLRIDRAYLIQSTQNSAGSVPIIANRDALLRVFVRADQSNTAAPRVRVRFYNSAGTVIDTRTINAPSSSTPTTLSEGTLNSTWNTTIPGSLLQPNVKMLVDVDDNNAVTESVETDNAWPTSGTPTALDVRTVPALDLVLISVAIGGRTGNVTTSNGAQFLSMLKTIWPLATVNATLRSAVYSSSLPSLQSSDGNGSWNALLSEISALRAAEFPTKYAYGIAKVSYTSGIYGLGYLGRPAAIGVDFLPAGDETLAHELGHNFNRRHTNCGGPANPDPNYPYANAAIGVYGYDSRVNALISPITPDIMSYCNNPWIGDYGFRVAMDYFKAHPPSAGSSPSMQAVESVLIWGRIEADTVVLEPAVELKAIPSVLPTGGEYQLAIRDAIGAPLLSFNFTPDEVADGARTARHFAYIIPKTALANREVGSLELRSPGRRRALIEARPAAAASGAAASARPATLARRVAGRLEVSWDATRYPVAVIRSSRTGEILSFARGGVASVVSDDSAVDVALTDGVRTTSLRVGIPR